MVEQLEGLLTPTQLLEDTSKIVADELRVHVIWTERHSLAADDQCLTFMTGGGASRLRKLQLLFGRWALTILCSIVYDWRISSCTIME